MKATDLLVLNLSETRRRSILLWRSLPDAWLSWRPDRTALSFGEMIRHVWGASYGYHMILNNNGSLPKNAAGAPYEQEPIVSVEKEIEMSEPYFRDFITFVESMSEEDLRNRIIDRSDVGYRRTMGDMLMRVAYHEAVHAGQFLQYMRMAGLDRPMIWD